MIHLITFVLGLFFRQISKNYVYPRPGICLSGRFNSHLSARFSRKSRSFQPLITSEWNFNCKMDLHVKRESGTQRSRDLTKRSGFIARSERHSWFSHVCGISSVTDPKESAKRLVHDYLIVFSSLILRYFMVNVTLGMSYVFPTFTISA